jgi:hypothetical protein
MFQLTNHSTTHNNQAALIKKTRGNLVIMSGSEAFESSATAKIEVLARRDLPIPSRKISRVCMKRHFAKFLLHREILLKAQHSLFVFAKISQQLPQAPPRQRSKFVKELPMRITPALGSTKKTCAG